MLNRFTSLSALGLLLAALAFPPDALASRVIAGRITAYSPTSVSVVDKEVVTFAIDARTTYTKLITRKPWQESTALTASALAVGRYVVIHPRNDANVAEWVAIATDLRAGAAAVPFAPAVSAAQAQAPSGDILPAKEVRDLIANAKTPAEHTKLAKHFAAIAARYETEATDHVAEAAAYRNAPNPSASKRPGAPDTAAHCERLAKAAQQAAAAARDLARDHERMATGK
jgi:hypothetical protein